MDVDASEAGKVIPERNSKGQMVVRIADRA